MPIESIESLQDALRQKLYIAERGLATSIFLAHKLSRPLFLEGDAGVGKTEIAKVMASILDTDLIRLQCYEGLDVHHAVYEWNYTRQMMAIRLMEAQGDHTSEEELFSHKFLLRRPLLQAIESKNGKPPVLLVDEIDRSDEEFEAFLLEVLSDFQITIPEIGTLRATEPPFVVITSNRTREVHDALKRRCVYYWIDYPPFEKELQIVQMKIPQAPGNLARQVTHFIQELRQADLYKIPGIAETIDWTSALVALDQTALDESIIQETLGVILKYHDDIDKIGREELKSILNRVKNA
ncbi:MAG: MoxR family ATPase [Anaerolineales bacterium]|nr:MAG: MoxR family ATPase [Anaerolineales bacterium]